MIEKYLRRENNDVLNFYVHLHVTFTFIYTVIYTFQQKSERI